MTRRLRVIVDLDVHDASDDETVADAVFDVLCSVGTDPDALAAFDETVYCVNGTEWERRQEISGSDSSTDGDGE
jgi:hypothetical protein